jgi:hypothetical protein
MAEALLLVDSAQVAVRVSRHEAAAAISANSPADVADRAAYTVDIAFLARPTRWQSRQVMETAKAMLAILRRIG